MRDRWRRRHDPFQEEVRASRPEPSSDFAQRVAASVRARREAPRSPLRVAVALGSTVLLLAAVASFGGFGYAANAVRGGGGGGGNQATAQNGGPSQEQYKRFICHRTGSKKNPWVLIEVSENAVPAHQAHGDIIFPPGTTREEAEAACPPPNS
jgi:hypothetical protein